MSAFPVIVSPVTQSAEAPGRYGPYLVGTNRYEITLTLLPTTLGGLPAWQPYLSAFKSTDGGVTWAEMDSADRPICQGPSYTAASTPYCCAQSVTDPTKLYAFYQDPSNGEIAVVCFDASTDTWGVLLSDSGQILDQGSASYGQYGYAANGFMVAVGRPDGSILFAWPGDTYTDASNEAHLITSLMVYTPSGNTWGAPFDAGYLDYPSVIGWHQVPCGLVIDSSGAAHLFTQQVTHLVPLAVQSIGPGDTVPWFCNSVDVEVWGDGAGGGGADGAAPGSGGSAGAYNSGNVGVTPLSTLAAAVIGTGGAGGPYAGVDGQPGSGTIWLGVSAAGGGLGGITGGGGAGDPGGGDGGDGAASPYGAGSPGSPGSGYIGGAGGAGAPGNPAGYGGDGGSYEALPFPTATNGEIGGLPGGGGGGGAAGGIITGGAGGQGGAGQAGGTYQPVQGTVYNSRLWQQQVNADNSLGTLQEITDGEFPPQAFEQLLCLMPIDCVAASGYVAIAFSGAYNTSGYTGIEIMVGANADPVSFSGGNVPTGNTDIEPSPALAIDPTGKLYCAFKQASDALSTIFVYVDSSTSFATLTTIGVYADSWCRLQAAAFGAVLEITFAQPSPAYGDYAGPPI